MADVFVSYARTDKAQVAPLIAALQSRGWNVWWDPAITPGQEFDRQIAAELESAAAVLVIWTAQSVESRWVRGEARDGADRGVLVPVRLGNARLPIDFRAFHTIDLTADEIAVRGPGVQEIVRALDALISRRTASSDVATQDRNASPAAAPRAEPVATTAGKASICVLPFTSVSGDEDQQVFSDGIAEDIIRELSRWRTLSVRSRSASFRYRANDVDPARIARELKVRYVVEGSVRRMGPRIRISVELIDTETGSPVWAERFDRAQSELFDVQDEVAQRIVSTIVGRVQVSDVERARRKPPANLDAYELVLRGNALPWDDPEGNAEAMRLFQQAIALDPGYAIAYALLATMRCGQWRENLRLDDAVLLDAYALAKRAVELDDGDSTCHSLLSNTCMYRRQFELSLQHIRRSVELNPNNPWNMADMGLMLAYIGDPREAIDWFARAKAVDPFFDPPWHWRQAGLAHMVLHQFEHALAMFAHVSIRSFRIWAYLAACHARLGDVRQADSSRQHCLQACPDFSIARFMTREPFRRDEAAAHMVESLRLAGLPA